MLPKKLCAHGTIEVAMYFKPFLIEKILADEKKQTRRLVKPGQGWASDADDKPIKSLVIDHNGRTKWRVGSSQAVCPGRGKPTVWWRNLNGTIQQAHLITVQGSVLTPELNGTSWYDCAKRSANEWQDWLLSYDFKPLRIRITAIRREDVRTISEADAKAEGFSNRFEFFEVWCGFHDKPAPTKHTELTADTVFDIVRSWDPQYAMPYLEDWKNQTLDKRPADRYTAWALTFEVAS
jgi:hypothetical protein